MIGIVNQAGLVGATGPLVEAIGDGGCGRGVSDVGDVSPR